MTPDDRARRLPGQMFPSYVGMVLLGDAATFASVALVGAVIVTVSWVGDRAWEEAPGGVPAVPLGVAITAVGTWLVGGLAAALRGPPVSWGIVAAVGVFAAAMWLVEWWLAPWLARAVSSLRA